MIIFSVTDKEFANGFTTALSLEGLHGKYFLALFVARDEACIYRTVSLLLYVWSAFLT